MKKHIASMDTITTNNQHYKNNFVCVLEDRYTQEEVKKLLNGESVLDYEGNEDFIHEEEEDGQYRLSVSLYDDSDVSNLTLLDDDVIII
mgnify:CR=1 FL=1